MTLTIPPCQPPEWCCAPAPARVQAKLARTAEIRDRLAARYPQVTTALDYRSAWELLVATILSAQSTDVVVNQVTPELFRRYPTVADLAAADRAEVEVAIRATGFFRNKARSIQGAAAYLLSTTAARSPRPSTSWSSCSVSGGKTANVVLGTYFSRNEGVVVDTHVGRLSRRLGLTINTDLVKVERELMDLVPMEEWTIFSHRLIWFGRGCARPRTRAATVASWPTCAPRRSRSAASPRRRPVLVVDAMTARPVTVAPIATGSPPPARPCGGDGSGTSRWRGPSWSGWSPRATWRLRRARPSRWPSRSASLLTEVMSTEPVTVWPDEPVEVAARLLVGNGIGCSPGGGRRRPGRHPHRVRPARCSCGCSAAWRTVEPDHRGPARHARRPGSGHDGGGRARGQPAHRGHRGRPGARHPRRSSCGPAPSTLPRWWPPWWPPASRPPAPDGPNRPAGERGQRARRRWAAGRLRRPRPPVPGGPAGGGSFRRCGRPACWRRPTCSGFGPAADADLELVHDRDYLEALARFSLPAVRRPTRGGDLSQLVDNRPFPGMDEAARLVAGATIAALDAVAAGDLAHVFAPVAGLAPRPAAPARSGSAVNVAVAIARCTRSWPLRVLYVDLDAHHGDGVQAAFYDDPRVCTVSLHETGRYLFPGSGRSTSWAARPGWGSVNPPLEPRTGDDGFLAAFDAVVEPLAAAFRPDMLVTQNGCDGHVDDPSAT